MNHPKRFEFKDTNVSFETLTSEYFLFLDDLFNRTLEEKKENMSKAYAFEAAFCQTL